jgi:hypothetical protein
MHAERLPEGADQCADVAGMKCVRQAGPRDVFRTHASRVITWTLKPARGDLVRLRAHLAGDDGLDTLAETVVASLRLD